MTREKAVEILRYIKDHPTIEGDIVPVVQEIFDMAIKALEQEPCDDAISREELLKSINTWDRFGVDDTNSLFRLDNLSLPHYVSYIHYDDVIECIKGMPSVNSQEPKTGHWEQYGNSWEDKFKCSECGKEQPKILCGERIIGHWSDYCPNCGAKMESEEENEDNTSSRNS